MSKKLALLAFAAITVFGSTSVCANIEAQCRAALGASKRATADIINKRCACVKARHEHHKEAFAAANEHCKDNNDRP